MTDAEVQSWLGSHQEPHSPALLNSFDPFTILSVGPAAGQQEAMCVNLPGVLISKHQTLPNRKKKKRKRRRSWSCLM